MSNHLCSFPKQERLCSERQITELFQKGVSFISYPLRVVVRIQKVEKDAEVKVVMSVPKKKLKHAVDRNKVKRILRESYRQNKQRIQQKSQETNQTVHLAFVWIPTEILSFHKVNKKINNALGKIEKMIQVIEDDNKPSTI